MAKTMLNQTMSRPILYAYAQEVIAKTPSKWLTGKNKKKIIYIYSKIFRPKKSH